MTAIDAGQVRLHRWRADDLDGPSPRPLPDLPGGAPSDGTVLLRPLCPDDVDDMRTLNIRP